MSKFLVLTKTLMKSNFDSMMSSKKTKNKTATIIFMTLLYLFAFASIVIPSVMGITFLFESTPALTGLIFAFGIFITSIIILMFSIFTIPSIYYYGKDVPMLLPLPIRAEMIIGSKFFISYIYELFFSVPIIGLLAGSYFYVFGFSFYVFIFSIIAMFLVPIIPIIYISIAMMLLIRFTPLFRNKERFNLFVGLFGIAFAIGISLFSSSLSDGNIGGIIEAITVGKFDGLFQIFPTNSILMNAFQGNALYLIIYIILIAVSIGIFLFIAKLVYFKGALNIADATSKKVILSDESISKRVTKRSMFRACIKKESLSLRRNTTYFLNCVLAPYIIPIAMFGGFYFSMQKASGGTMSDFSFNGMFSTFQSESFFIAILIFVGLGLGLLLSASSSISSTGISREGEQVYTMKFIPIPYKTQILAKVYIGVYYMIVPLFLFAIGIIFIGLGIQSALIFFVSCLVSTVLSSYIGIYIDLVHPKLTWTQESAAVKQNLNSLFHILVIFAIGGIFVGFGLLIKLSLLPLAILLTILCILMSILLHLGLNKMCKRSFAKF